MIATWDDHDYGVNDSGREYPAKEGSRQAMLDFFVTVWNTNRRSPAEQQIRIILVDMPRPWTE